MSLEEQVKEILATCKFVMLSTIAKKCDITELEAARALPEDMRSFCAGGRFSDIWTQLETWNSATFIMTHCGNVMEIKGKLPPGKMANGYFNLASGYALGGHINYGAVHNICFLSMPFMGLESHSLQFFNNVGEVMFSIYAGRENHKLIPDVVEKFKVMCNDFCHS